MTLPHAICEGLWPSPNSPWSFRGLHIGVRSAPVSFMSTSQRPRGGSREHVIYEGSRDCAINFVIRASWSKIEGYMHDPLQKTHYRGPSGGFCAVLTRRADPGRMCVEILEFVPLPGGQLSSVGAQGQGHFGQRGVAAYTLPKNSWKSPDPSFYRVGCVS